MKLIICSKSIALHNDTHLLMLFRSQLSLSHHHAEVRIFVDKLAVLFRLYRTINDLITSRFNFLLSSDMRHRN